ncbi:hypothetical protein MUCCIDRAFT_92236 [Mucor lusitanicus CBS 277.49]|uniref:LIM zinc-binding domain-containing protein n=1 Tax=Mucor lusitanicus CBS 277.49 TaxID=747725 RepID=A0A162QK49_MUCCL|nr:hypothetical protein MUCCIDRAFT_92236 [Mucor lusitanicus CBS 277.49]
MVVMLLPLPQKSLLSLSLYSPTMSFCIYCNQNVYTNTSTCPKCYRTIQSTSTSTATTTSSKRTTEASSSLLAKAAMFPSQRRLSQANTDKWQDTYGKKAIFNGGAGLGSTSTPIRTRQQRAMPQFDLQQPKDNSNMKSCAQCQRKQNSWTDLNNFSIYNSAYYCKPCLTEKLACKPVDRTDIQTLFNNQTWHSCCFQCHHCKSPLKSMLASIDSQGKPSCRTCQLKDQMQVNQSPKPGTPSISTPVLSSLASSSRSTAVSGAAPSTTTSTENPYFRYQRTRRTSMFNSTNALAQDETMKPRSVSPTSPSVSTASYASMDSTVSTQTAASVEPTKTSSTASAPRRRKVVKKPCKECGQHVSKKDYRGLRIHTGEVLCFHTYCLFCAKCHQTFNGLEFCTDGKNFYHTECPSSATAPSPVSSAVGSRQGTPHSEEDEAYPRTPSPHNAYFDIVSSSPTDASFPAPATQAQKKQDVAITPEPTMVMCNTCSKPVTDTCLELSNNFYHKECLLCAGCNKTVPTDRKLIKHQDKLYCDHCTPTNTKPMATSTTTSTTKRAGKSDLKINTDADAAPRRNSTITTPSDIFKSRKKVLPRLGGVRTCARCNESMPFSDTQPGPNASRWHKKCLRCTGCKKQMDSDAHMTVNKETGLCLVYCRDCLDETPKPRFVR